MDFLKNSASYNLTLQGTFGVFKPPGSETGTLMFQTWVSFDGSGMGLLERIKPVREQFDTKSMELDDIVQRDIDDARVTGELIPYLLNREGVQQPFRMFPNIIVNLVPVDKTKKLKAHHEPVTNRIYVKDSQEATIVNARNDVRLIFSGLLGEGDFCAVWPVKTNPDNSNESLHEYRHVGELQINTTSTELVVVDGQHRAMSLIALYRNITNTWDTSGSRGNKYRQYYEYIWPGAALDANSLSNISLPVTICLYPELCEGNLIASEIDFTQALRRNFTTLNSPAVPITRERKLLLTETDLISSCMRALTRYMTSFAAENPDECHFSMYNLELDKKKDQASISNKICSFSVSSLHKVSELMLLSGLGEYTSSLSDNGNYGKRSLLDETNFSSRLLLDDIFDPTEKPISRFNFKKSQAVLISDQFVKVYAPFATKILLKFLPIEFHHAACAEVDIDLAGDQSNRLQSLLFDGQGQQEVIKEFQKMISNPSQRFAEPLKGAKFDQCKLSVDADLDSILAQYKRISSKRARKLLSRVSTLSKVAIDSFADDFLAELFSFLWELKYKSVAFQSALVMTPLILIESLDKSNGQRLGDLLVEPDTHILDNLSLEAILDDFIAALNSFFAPETKGSLKRLLSLFNGEPVKDQFDLNDISTWSFKSNAPGPRFGTVVTNSMDPKYWCAYRYILLEIYAASSSIIAGRNGVDELTANDFRTCISNQLSPLRKTLIRKVYGEIYRQKSESPEVSDEDVEKVSIAGTMDRINIILANCGVAKTSQLTTSDIESEVQSRRGSTPEDLDSASIQIEEEVVEED
jgi:hypothetical protein